MTVTAAGDCCGKVVISYSSLTQPGPCCTAKSSPALDWDHGTVRTLAPGVRAVQTIADESATNDPGPPSRQPPRRRIEPGPVIPRLPMLSNKPGGFGVVLLSRRFRYSDSGAAMTRSDHIVYGLRNSVIAGKRPFPSSRNGSDFRHLRISDISGFPGRCFPRSERATQWRRKQHRGGVTARRLDARRIPPHLRFGQPLKTERP